MKVRFILIASLLISFSLYAQKPKVSIIAFLDEYSSIEHTLADVYNQTCFSDLELLFIDTGIVDCSVAKTYSQGNSQIRLFNADPTSNPSELLNGILSYCRGDYIMMLASGDSLNPIVIEKYVQAFEADKHLDVVYASTFVRYEPYSRYEETNRWYWINKPKFDQALLYYNLPGRQCMWRKSMHKKFGLFDTSYEFFYFLEFWNRAAHQGAQIKKLDISSGFCFLPYGTHKKLFNSTDKNTQGYQEIKTIYENYHALYKTKTTQFEHNKSFVIITASYKNADWYKRNLDSLFNQNYDNYRIIYIDDASPDSTGQLVQEYINECKQDHKVTLIRNTERQGAVANIYKAAHLCKPDEIILIVDGDDWLAHDNVLNRLNEIYQDPNVWATYGQFMWFPFALEGFAAPTSPDVIANNNFRGAAWNITHLRTYYAGLYQKIKKEDLMYEDRFYPMTGDLAVMYPIMEMAGSHAAYIADILYIYNAENSMNDNKVNIELQGKCGHHILCRPPYQPLNQLS